jgi:hypothetical protein
MSDYPQRPKFWAMKVIRTLQKTGAANRMGRDAAWLVTTIAAMEDVKRYSGPVAFWNSHLMDVTGFGHKGTFLKARAAAVSAGWLVYFEGRKGQAATYWTAIPEHAVQFSDGSVLEEDAGSESDQQKQKCRSESGPTSGPESGPESGPHSLPIPLPIVAVGASLPSAAASDQVNRKQRSYPQHFEDVWNAYPATRRKNKVKTFSQYQDAILRVCQTRNCSRSESAEWLLTRVQEFSTSHYGQKFAPESERWFRNDRFHDSPESWSEFQKAGTAITPEVQKGFDLVKRAIRQVENKPGYKALLQQKLPKTVFAAADRVGWIKFFELSEFNERNVFSSFSGELNSLSVVAGGQQ